MRLRDVDLLRATKTRDIGRNASQNREFCTFWSQILSAVSYGPKLQDHTHQATSTIDR